MPDGQVVIITEPDDTRERNRALGALADRQQGVVVMTASPGSTALNYFVRDLGEAFGRSDQTSFGQRNASEGLFALTVIGCAEPVEHVVVRHAELLDGGKWAQLESLCCLWGAKLWLSAQGVGFGEIQKRWARLWGAQPVDWEGFRAMWKMMGPGSTVGDGAAPARPAGRPPRAEVDSDTPWVVPVDHFALWRARCQDVLEADEFRWVDELFLEHFASARAWLADWNRDESSLLTRLHELTFSSTTQPEAVTRIRAWEVALLHADVLVRDRYSAMVSDALDSAGRTLPVTPATSARLRIFFRPRVAVAGLLHLIARASYDQLIAARVEDVDQDASAFRVDGVTHLVPEHAREVLLAGLLWREFSGAEADEPLLVVEDSRDGDEGNTALKHKGLQLMMRRLSEDCGLVMVGEHSKRSGETPPQWASRRGISIVDLREGDDVR